MTFIHEDPEFEQLLRIVAARPPNIGEALVEKDYWVTHTLWALQQSGLAVYFKGGTSLSKAFRLIERFSEDIDAWVDRGTVDALPEVTNWTSTNRGPTEIRRRFYEGLPGHIQIPGATIELDPERFPEDARGAVYFVRYEGRFLAGLAPPNLPYIQLEVGYADVVPNFPEDLSSFVHDFLEAEGRLAEYQDNRPRQLPTVHPLATLIEKLEAIERRYHREDRFEPATFVRHYEDAARIIRQAGELRPLGQAPLELARQMVERRQIRALPDPEGEAFRLNDEAKRELVERAYEAIQHMFWGPRIPLTEACETITAWLQDNGIAPG